jgi:hypothetical protein
MTLLLPPNVHGSLTRFLQQDADVLALVNNSTDRIVTELRKDQVYPALRITQIGDLPITQRPLYQIQSTFQLDAFGGSKAQALTLARTARAVCHQRFTGAHFGTVVTGVDSNGFADVPDDFFSPAKPRYLFVLIVYAHP